MNHSADHWDEAQIHAWIDGELDAATAARLQRACGEDPALAARVEAQRRLRSLLRSAYDPVVEEPVPASLQRALEATASTVVPLDAARPARRTVQPVWLGALAASLVLGLLLGWLMPRETGLPVAPGSDGMLAAGPLRRALDDALSSDAPAAGVRVALSFRAHDGAYCRAFSLDSGADGLACRRAQGWRVEVLGATSPPPAGSDGYRQAASGFSAALLSAIDEQLSGEMLTAAQEQQLRERRWSAAGSTP